jgi:uroporphyrinogen-III synthase
VKPCIIVRPEPGNQATAEAARALGLNVVATSLYSIIPAEFNIDLSISYDAILITSLNSIRTSLPALKQLTHLPLLAVGKASAQAARKAGFDTIITGDADGQALGQKAVELGFRHVLHLVGDPFKHVQVEGLTCDVRTVYRAAELPVPPELEAALQEPCVILAHSPRAARRLSELAGAKGASSLIALSAQVAEAAGDGWKHLLWPERPSADAMLGLAAPLCADE